MPSPPLSPRAGAATGDAALAALLAENERLRVENRALRGRVLGVTDALLSPAGSAEPAAGAGAGAGADGSFTELAPAELALPASATISNHEMAAMRAIFDLFDEDRDGRISVADLAKLHAKLGEPLTPAEARDAVDVVGKGAATISFDDLARYWDGSHPALAKGAVEDGVRPDELTREREARRTWYRARFKFMRAKIPNAAVGRISTEDNGAPCPSLEYRLGFFYNDPHEGKVPISPWHDVPLRNGDGTYNMIVEIPKWTRKKFEIATGELYNPVRGGGGPGRERREARARGAGGARGEILTPSPLPRRSSRT